METQKQLDLLRQAIILEIQNHLFFHTQIPRETILKNSLTHLEEHVSSDSSIFEKSKNSDLMLAESLRNYTNLWADSILNNCRDEIISKLF